MHDRATPLPGSLNRGGAFKLVLERCLGFSRQAASERKKSFQAKEAACTQDGCTKMKGEETMWEGCGLSWKDAGPKCGDASRGRST